MGSGIVMSKRGFQDMSHFTSPLDELLENIKGLSFNSYDLNKMFVTTPHFTPLLSEEVLGKNKVDIEKRERVFTTTIPVFINRIELFGEGYKGIELSVYTSENVVKLFSVDSKAKSVSIRINEFCVKFSVRSKISYVRPKLSSLYIYGFDFRRAQKMQQALSEFVVANYNITSFVEDAKSTVSDLEVKHEALSVEVSEGEEHLGKLKKSVLDLQLGLDSEHKTLEKLELNVKAARTVISSLNSEIEAKENNSQQLAWESKSLKEGLK